MATLGTQIQLLLWKNLTIRKRKPFLLVAELLLPLALLGVLCYVRHQQPPVLKPQTSYRVRFLPSAGLIPMLETLFCKGGEADDFGFSHYTNSSSTTILRFIEEAAGHWATVTAGVAAEGSNELPDVCDQSLGPKQNRTKVSSAIVLWTAVQQLICGQSPVLPPHMNTTADFIEYLGIIPYYQGRLALMVHALSQNPRILYTPDTQQARRIVTQANVTLAYMDSLSSIARTFLLLPRPLPFELPIPEDQATLVSCAWLELMQDANLDLFQPFATEDEAVDYFLYDAAAENVSVLAVLSLHLTANESLPRHLHYTIRQNASLTASTVVVRQRSWLPGPRDYDYNYYEFGFSWLQDAVERGYASLLTNHSLLEPATAVHEMPYPCYLQDQFLFYLQTVMPLCLTLGWACSVALQVLLLVQERRDQLAQVMQTLGVSSSALRLSWLATALLLGSPTALAATLILKFGRILPYSDASLVFCLLQLFVLDNIAMAHLLSALCVGRARTAAACSIIVYFLFYIPYVYVSVVENTAQVPVSSSVKAITCLLSPSAFNLAFKYIGFYEQQGTGVGWSTWAVSPVEDDSFSLALVMLVMVLDPLLYALIVCYLERVFPVDGPAQRWYFPLSPRFWRGIVRGAGVDAPHHTQEGASTSRQSSGVLQEQEPQDLPLAVDIRDLHVRFPGERRSAVDGLSLRLYQGQVTALLGHNGAGKTTTLSVLCGLLPASGGHVTVGGRDVRSQLSTVRASLGFCPQRDVLFEGLTAAEHLWFYARIRGLDDRTARQQAISALSDVDLLRRRDADVRLLSGGQRRKLSVCVAFLGGSTCIVLDEPTAGVDPHSRRAIWRLIAQHRAGRAILFCTHHMEEADVLGNRIAIMSAGKVRCVGSPAFLRQRLGAGYYLHVSRDPPMPRPPAGDAAAADSDPDSGRCRASEPGAESDVTTLVRHHVGTARLVFLSRHELHYLLPSSGLRAGGTMSRLLRHLQTQARRLHVTGFGVQTSSMEELFLRVSRHGHDDSSVIAAAALTDDALAAMDDVTTSENLTSADSNVSTSQKDYHREDAAAGSDVTASSEASLQPVRDFSGMTSYAPNNTASSLPHDRSDDVTLTSYNQSNLFSTSSAHHDMEESAEEKRPQTSDASTAVTMKTKRPVPPLVTGRQLLWQQWMAIVYKRIFCARRDWMFFISSVLLPSFFTILAMSVAVVAPNISDQPALVMSPAQYYNYTDLVVPTANNQQDLLNDGFTTDASSAQLEATLRMRSGLSATCVLKDPWDPAAGFDPFCRTVHPGGGPIAVPPWKAERRSRRRRWASTLTTLPPDAERFYPQCRCREDGSGQRCPLGGYRLPHGRHLISSETLQNISRQPETDYYRYTTDIYRNRRYGGLSVGLVHDVTPPQFGRSLSVSARRTSVRRVAKAWFDNNGLHAVPAFINTINNALLRANLPADAGDPAAYGITCFNHPLPHTEKFGLQEQIRQGTDVLIAVFLLVALSFVPASLVLSLVSERRTRSRHLQRLCGINAVVYWLANYACDLVATTLPSAGCILIIVAFGDPAYTSAANLPAVALLILLYGWSMTPLMYPLTLAFREPPTAYMGVLLMNLFLGAAAILTTSMFESFAQTTTVAALKAIFLVLPSYCLGRGVLEIAYNHYHNDFLAKTGQATWFVPPLTGVAERYLIAMAVMAVVGLVLTLVLERRRQLCRRSKPSPTSVPTRLRHPSDPNSLDETSLCSEDRDVTAERLRVASGASSGDVLKLYNLSKVYRRGGGVTAVDRLCFSVAPGECFGLLGVNGAGKTSTFRMLTADAPVTSGDALVRLQSAPAPMDVSIAARPAAALQAMGYCPQQDALHGEMTPRQHLTVYAMIRGVSRAHVLPEVEHLLQTLQLTHCADRPVSTLSVGTRRRLSTALALVASPPLILLDEPTTGMDPVCRRALWDLVRARVAAGHAVLLTSHTMDECEQLCTRLAVMVNGRLSCIGSPQHLKDRFGDGYTVTIRCREDEPGDVDQVVRKHLPTSKLKECHLDVWTYEVWAGGSPTTGEYGSISSGRLPLAELFTKLELIQTELNMPDCHVSQNTLESVFISLVRDQSTGSATADRPATPTAEQSVPVQPESTRL